MEQADRPRQNHAMDTPSHVAIVGCGFTGSSALFQLIDRHPVRRITVFEASGRFGPGYAYRPDESRDYLINNTTDTMCLVPSNRSAFLHWLAARGAAAIDAKGHLPRGLYGEFLADVVRAACTAAAVKGIRVELIPAEVSGLREPESGGVEIDWRGGTTCADAVILATGRCPDIDTVGARPPDVAALYFPTHIGAAGWDQIALDATCHVLGASLSAYDIVNRLFSPDTGCRFERDASGTLVFQPGPNRRRVLLCSRSGRLKKIESRRPMPIRRSRLVAPVLAALAEEGRLDLQRIAALVDEEAALHGTRVDWAEVLQPYRGCETAEAVERRAAGILVRDIAAARGDGPANFLVDLVNDAQLLLWDGFAARWLPPGEERRYRSQAETAMLSYAAPCPLPTAERLLALQRAGRLSVRRGTAGVSLASDGRSYRLQHAHGVDHAGVLLNATGAVDRRIHGDGQPAWVEALRAQGRLRSYRRGDEPLEGAEVDMQSFRAAGSRSIYLANMLLWGPGFFTSSAFMMATIVERLLAAMFAPQPAGAPPTAPAPSR